MAYKIGADTLERAVGRLLTEYRVYAPCLLEGWGTFSDTDIVGYGQIENAGQIVFGQRSMYSFKEAVMPVSQTLFYFTDDEFKPPAPVWDKAVIFLRGCDLHGLARLDDIYRGEDKHDFYYERLRGNAKFIVMGCDPGFDGCFCQSMGTDTVPDCDGYIIPDGGGFILHTGCKDLSGILDSLGAEKVDFTPKPAVSPLKVDLPESIPAGILTSPVWDEYDNRCISCGRCNFVCPTCSCFTMQDIFYADNQNAGERRRVWASCQVDGYTDIAGGHSFRGNKSQRKRFKTLHKIFDHKKRFGRNMCVGCGRCDAVCPEYISHPACIEKIAKARGEVSANG